MLPPVLTSKVPNARCEIQHTPLRQRPIHQHLHVRRRIPNSLQPPRNAQSVEETRYGLVEVQADFGVWDGSDGRVELGSAGEDGERLAMAVRRGGRGELEYGRPGECDTGCRQKGGNSGKDIDAYLTP